ncbi:MAG: NAD(P)-dependent oxidoreductase [Candidatus Paceibacterota bacterium]
MRETILSKATKADVRSDPFPHIIIRDALSEELCDELLASYPSLDILSRGQPFGDNERLSLSAHDTLEDNRIPEIWNEFVKTNSSQLFLEQFLSIFEDEIKKWYPDFENKIGPINQLRAGTRKIDSFKYADVMLDAQPSANTPSTLPSSVRGAHLDDPSKLFFGLYYMRHPDDKSRGGELILHKYKKEFEDASIFNYRKNVSDKYMEEVGRLPYEKNTLFLALNTPNAVHGVSPRSPSQVPRYFLNILGEINTTMFRLPEQNKLSQIISRLSLHGREKREKPQPTSFIQLGFNIPGRKAIYIDNPKNSTDVFPILYDYYNLFFPSDLPSLSESDKKSVIGIITGKGGGPFSRELLDQFPNSKVLGITGGSVKKYGPEIAIKHGIPVINTSDIYANAVAEFTLMAMITGIRRAAYFHRRLKSGLWTIGEPKTSIRKIQSFLSRSIKKIGRGTNVEHIGLATLNVSVALIEKIPGFRPEGRRRDPLLGKWNPSKKEYNASVQTLQGASVGIIGIGPVARKLIALLKPFNCDILVYSEHLTSSEERALGVRSVSLFEACKANIVTIHRGLSDRTKGSFGKKQINFLRSGAVLVNTSRGAVVDENALIERLRKNDIYACLDVFSKEPLPRHHPFRKMPNVFATPHIANSADSIYREALQQLGHDIHTTLEGHETKGRILRSIEEVEQMT